MEAKTCIFKELPPTILSAIESLKEGNKQISEGTKKVENSKKVIADFLDKERKVVVKDLEIGQIVIIKADNGEFGVEIGKQNRFDIAVFATENGIIYEKYKKDFPVIKYKI